MAEFTFDFAVDSRVAEVLPPDDTTIQDMNGWDYTPVDVLPYRRSFKVVLEGMRWYFDGAGALDVAFNPTYNAGRLEQFYVTHRLSKPFDFVHEYLGTMEMRFKEPMAVPKARPNSNGLCEDFEIMMIHHNPQY